MRSQAQIVGLGGDGDEVAALQEVEEAFGLKLDYADAHNWTTVGDVWAALLRELPAEAADEPKVWERFVHALCRVTGSNPADIDLDSGLIAEDGIWVHVANASRILWFVMIVAGVVGIGWLFRST